MSSAEAIGVLRRRLEAGLSSEQLHSAVQVERRPGPAQNADYWLIVDADLILYGATVPGSKVTIQGVPVRVDEHGRFWARFALPDGTLPLPVSGISPDQRFERGFDIRVDRGTRRT
jgi:hypothetical protein